MTDAPHAATAPFADLVGFTEGPWDLGSVTDGDREGYTDTAIIFIGYEDEDTGCDVTVRGWNAQANAALIASAPTLYANDKLLLEINAELVAALTECVAALAMMTEPASINSSSVMSAWAAAVAAKSKGSAVLAKAASFTAGKSEGAT